MNDFEMLMSAKSCTKIKICPDYFVLTDGSAADIAEALSNICPADSTKVKVFIDHQTPCGSEKHANKQRALIDFAIKNNCQLYNGYGTSYQLTLEKHIKPGDIVAICGNFGSTYGCVGAYAVKLSPEEMVNAISAGTVEVKTPETFRLRLTGRLNSACAKDASLKAVSISEEAAGKLILVSGEGLASLNMSDRISFFHTLALSGCVTALLENDHPDVDAVLSLDEVVPYVIGPELTATPTPAEKFAAVDVTSVFIGGCSAGRIEDIRKAVSIINGRKINRKVRTTVAFASADVYIQAANEGLISELMDAGALVMNQGCSGCYAHSQALVDSKDVVLSTGSRICPNCNGEGDVPTYLCSAATAMESAIRGFICPSKV